MHSLCGPKLEQILAELSAPAGGVLSHVVRDYNAENELKSEFMNGKKRDGELETQGRIGWVR